MMETNPYAPPSSSDPVDFAPRKSEPASLFDALKYGARLGFKWATYITGPVAVIILVLSFCVTIYRLLFVEGLELISGPMLFWGALGMFGNALGFYAVSCAWGVIIGMVVCPTYYLLRGSARRPPNRS